MKLKISFFCIIAFLIVNASTINAQVPQAINFQAIARDAGGNILANTPIQIQLSILDGNALGPVIYKELRALTTNAYGSFSFQIGKSPYSVLSGSMEDIDWINGNKYLKIDYDPTNQLRFNLTLGTIQFVTVPYAFAAGSVYKIDLSNATNGDVLKYNSTSGNFEPSVSNLDWIYINNKPSFSAVATSGNYNDLSNKPFVFDGTWNSLTDKPSLSVVATSGNYNDLLNKPFVFDGTWNSLTDKPSLSIVATSGSYNDLINKPTTDGSETRLSVGSDLTVTGTGTSQSPYVIGHKNHSIGESYGGGIVFYVYDNGQHGLIATPADLSTEMRWSSKTNDYQYSMSRADGIGAGKANTSLIISRQGYGDGTIYAARMCNEYIVKVDGVTYGDWYLPSKFELNLLYLQKNVVGGFGNNNYNYYWSSTELSDPTFACTQDFDDGYQTRENKDYAGLHVRAIRAF
jgi:hypothetical protein